MKLESTGGSSGSQENTEGEQRDSQEKTKGKKRDSQEKTKGKQLPKKDVFDVVRQGYSDKEALGQIYAANRDQLNPPDLKPSTTKQVKDWFLIASFRRKMANEFLKRYPADSTRAQIIDWIRPKPRRAEEVNKLTSDASAAVAKLSVNRDQLTAVPEEELRSDFIATVQSRIDSFMTIRDQARRGYNTDDGTGRAERDSYLKPLEHHVEILNSMVKELEQWHHIRQWQRDLSTTLTDLHPGAQSVIDQGSKEVIATATEDYAHTLERYREQPLQPADTSAILSQTHTWFEDLPRRLTESSEKRFRGESKEVTRRANEKRTEIEEQVRERESQVAENERNNDPALRDLRNRASRLQKITDEYQTATSAPDVPLYQKTEAYLHWRDQFFQPNIEGQPSIEGDPTGNALAFNEEARITRDIDDIFEAFGKEAPNDKLRAEYGEIEKYKRDFKEIRDYSHSRREDIHSTPKYEIDEEIKGKYPRATFNLESGISELKRKKEEFKGYLQKKGWIDSGAQEA